MISKSDTVFFPAEYEITFTKAKCHLHHPAHHWNSRLRLHLLQNVDLTKEMESTHDKFRSGFT